MDVGTGQDLRAHPDQELVCLLAALEQLGPALATSIGEIDLPADQARRQDALLIVATPISRVMAVT
ncbi:MAG: hypothetical protein M5U33_02755 [Pseudorhodoplanes sp.]|nr:hypothetical protein [Pseudorhodoplanes sp.]